MKRIGRLVLLRSQLPMSSGGLGETMLAQTQLPCRKTVSIHSPISRVSRAAFINPSKALRLPLPSIQRPDRTQDYYSGFRSKPCSQDIELLASRCCDYRKAGKRGGKWVLFGIGSSSERADFPSGINPPPSRALRSKAPKADHKEQPHPSQGDVLSGGQQAVTGGIHLVVGPMFAGKTTALLKRVQAEAKAGRTVAMVKSDKDTRYGLAAIVSHDGMQMPCWAVPSLASFRAKIGEEAYAKLDVIGIDEAQFFKDLYRFCQVAADLESKTIIVAGLDGDFLRKSFGSILDLVPLADSIVKLSSHCELCGKPAYFTFRKTDEMNREVIGGTDIYMPVCRQHYLSGQIAMETARTVLDAGKLVSFQCDETLSR